MVAKEENHYKLKTVPSKITVRKFSIINMARMIGNDVPDHKLANAFPGHNCFAFECTYMLTINVIGS